MMKKYILPVLIACILASCSSNQDKSDTTAKHDRHQVKDSPESIMMNVMNQSMQAMHQAKQTGNPDYDFASMMIPHHQGAVDMAEALIAETKDAELTAFGKEVISAQQKEIATMTNFLKTASTQPIDEQEKFKSSMQSAMMAMMKGMHQENKNNSIDRDFVELMIPHHQSAVDMAKAYLPFADNAQIKKIAEDVIASQEKEIIWLKEKLTQL